MQKVVHTVVALAFVFLIQAQDSSKIKGGISTNSTSTSCTSAPAPAGPSDNPATSTIPQEMATANHSIQSRISISLNAHVGFVGFIFAIGRRTR